MIPWNNLWTLVLHYITACGSVKTACYKNLEKVHSSSSIGKGESLWKMSTEASKAP